jgi:quercetin dioxygenase-like cupin family protein
VARNEHSTSRNGRERRKIAGAKEGTMKEGVAHVPPGGGRSLRVLGELVTYKTTSERTGGAYSLFEVTTQPGNEVLPHVQHREEESFYVFEGEYEFLVEARTPLVVRARSSTSLGDDLHAHKNVGDKPARMLISQTPGGLHENFFEEISEPAKDESRSPNLENPPDLRRIAPIAAKYGIEVPPPIRLSDGEEPK